MASIRQMNTARQNGALSRGPVTEEGKRRSSQNAIRHGLLADTLVLCTEARAGFQNILDDHLTRLQPKDELEAGIIEKMVAADWRMRRLWALENQMFNDAYDFGECDDEVRRIENAFAALADTSKHALLQRYESRLDRMYHRALRNFTHLRANVPNAELPNEPPELNPYAHVPHPPSPTLSDSAAATPAPAPAVHSS